MTATVCPASRSASSSPTQTIGVSPAASAASGLLFTTCVGLAQDVPPLAVAEDHVAAAEVDGASRRSISPVKAPLGSKYMFCAP